MVNFLAIAFNYLFVKHNLLQRFGKGMWEFLSKKLLLIENFYY
jgi:hypothetical protein